MCVFCFHLSINLICAHGRKSGKRREWKRAHWEVLPPTGSEPALPSSPSSTPLFSCLAFLVGSECRDRVGDPPPRRVFLFYRWYRVNEHRSGSQESDPGLTGVKIKVSPGLWPSGGTRGQSASWLFPASKGHLLPQLVTPSLAASGRGLIQGPLLDFQEPLWFHWAHQKDRSSQSLMSCKHNPPLRSGDEGGGGFGGHILSLQMAGPHAARTQAQGPFRR